MTKNKRSVSSSWYDVFFNSFESSQYLDLKKRFDKDYEDCVLFEGYDFSKESWFRSTVASALNRYLEGSK